MPTFLSCFGYTADLTTEVMTEATKLMALDSAHVARLLRLADKPCGALGRVMELMRHGSLKDTYPSC